MAGAPGGAFERALEDGRDGMRWVAEVGRRRGRADVSSWGPRRVINALMGNRLRGGTMSPGLHAVDFQDSWDLQEAPGNRKLGPLWAGAEKVVEAVGESSEEQRGMGGTLESVHTFGWRQNEKKSG